MSGPRALTDYDTSPKAPRSSSKTRLIRSIRAASFSSPTSRRSARPATASANSASIPSSRTHSGSIGDAITGADANATDIPQTLPMTTDTFRAHVRLLG
jgi:hypothetical protein